MVNNIGLDQIIQTNLLSQSSQYGHSFILASDCCVILVKQFLWDHLRQSGPGLGVQIKSHSKDWMASLIKEQSHLEKETRTWKGPHRRNTWWLAALDSAWRMHLGDYPRECEGSHYVAWKGWLLSVVMCWRVVLGDSRWGPGHSSAGGTSVFMLVTTEKCERAIIGTKDKETSLPGPVMSYLLDG